MPFLLGIIGSLNSIEKEHISSHAKKYAREHTLQTIISDKCIIYAGSQHNESAFSDPILPLPQDQGFFIGKMFDRETFTPVSFSIPDGQSIINDPTTIMRLWWGRYAGTIYNKKNKRCTLIRDPQGLSTIYYAITNYGVLFSTEMTLLTDALTEKPSVNNSYFAEYIIGNNYALSSTPFNEIQELLPGMGLHIQQDGTTSLEQLWDVSACNSSFITDTDAFEHTLLATMKASLKAWTYNNSGICVELSGGADSSGLMILLRNILPESKNIIGVNYFDSASPSANEIEHAKEVTDMCNVPLHLIDWNESSLFDPLPTSWRPDKPTTFLMFYNTTQQLQDLAQQYNCSDIINGQGGDHVFLAPQPIEAIADYWLDNGFSGITKPAQEISNANRMSWSILARQTIGNIASYYGLSKNNIIQETNYFTPAITHKTNNDFYLDKSIATFYPAKKKHVKNLFHAQAYADRNQRINGRIFTHPLLSQPIVELGLKIPTYQSFNNGYDRIFFRNAVSRIQKSNALWRTIKGETSSSMSKAFSDQAGNIQDLLLNGYFVQNDLLNKEWFMQEMAKIRHGHIQNLWPIIRFVTAQLWFNQWKI